QMIRAIAPARRCRSAKTAQLSRLVSFPRSDARQIQLGLRRKVPYPHTDESLECFGGGPFQSWRKRSARCRDNRRPTSKRGCAPTENLVARNSRFRNARSPQLRATTSRDLKIQRRHLNLLEIHHARDAGTTQCLPRRSGNRWKCVQGRARLSVAKSRAIDRWSVQVIRTSGRC